MSFTVYASDYEYLTGRKPEDDAETKVITAGSLLAETKTPGPGEQFETPESVAGVAGVAGGDIGPAPATDPTPAAV